MPQHHNRAMNPTIHYLNMKSHPLLTHPVVNIDTKPPPILEFMEEEADLISPDSEPTKKVNAVVKYWLSEELLLKPEAHMPPHTFKAGDNVPHNICHSVFTSLFSYENAHQVAQAVRYVAYLYVFAIKLHGTTISCGCSTSS